MRRESCERWVRRSWFCGSGGGDSGEEEKIWMSLGERIDWKELEICVEW